jgi:hypothetical protein
VDSHKACRRQRRTPVSLTISDEVLFVQERVEVGLGIEGFIINGSQHPKRTNVWLIVSNFISNL